jgi:putative oxidoreductase
MRGVQLVRSIIGFAERWLAPVPYLAIRLRMADIFFRSGLLKIQNLPRATFLFSEVHPLPLLPAEIAAYLATANERICPVLLTLAAVRPPGTRLTSLDVGARRRIAHAVDQ